MYAQDKGCQVRAHEKDLELTVSLQISHEMVRLLAHVEYDAAANVRSTHPGWTNVMNYITHLHKRKKVHNKQNIFPNKVCVLGEQKNVYCFKIVA